MSMSMLLSITTSCIIFITTSYNHDVVGFQPPYLSQRRSSNALTLGAATTTSLKLKASPMDIINGTPEEKAKFLAELLASENNPNTATNLQQQNAEPFVFDQEPKKDTNKFTLIKQWAGDYNRKAALKIIEDSIQSANIVVFGFSDCPYTATAQQLVLEYIEKKKGAATHVFRDFDTVQPYTKKYALRAELAEFLNGRYKVPAIFVNGVYIGGLQDNGGVPNDTTQTNEYNGLEALLADGGDAFEKLLQQ